MSERRFSTAWFEKHIPNWQAWLAHLRDVPNVRALEIGSFEGRSACWLCENILNETGMLYCVDPYSYATSPAIKEGLRKTLANRTMPAVHQLFLENTAEFRHAGKLVHICEPSHIALKKMPLEFQFDFIYIDGCHYGSRALEDSVFAWQHAKQGAVIVWDDYRWEHDSLKENRHLGRPKIAIDAFLAIYETQYELIHHGGQVAIRRTFP